MNSKLPLVKFTEIKYDDPEHPNIVWVQPRFDTWLLYINALSDMVNRHAASVCVKGRNERVGMGTAATGETVAYLLNHEREPNETEEATFISALSFHGLRTSTVRRHPRRFVVEITAA